MNADEFMQEIRDQLDRIEKSTKRTEQAVFGDEAIGLAGLVKDVKDIKAERQTQAIKAAGVAGLVSGAVIGGKAVLSKIFGGT